MSADTTILIQNDGDYRAAIPRTVAPLAQTEIKPVNRATWVRYGQVDKGFKMLSNPLKSVANIMGTCSATFVQAFPPITTF